MLGDIDPAEFLRIALKVRAEGIVSLTDVELRTYEAGREQLRPYVEMAASQMEHPGFALWEWMGPIAQERYADITPEVLGELWTRGELDDSE